MPQLCGNLQASRSRSSAHMLLHIHILWRWRD